MHINDHDMYRKLPAVCIQEKLTDLIQFATSIGEFNFKSCI
jgi:hypothetical protein